MQLLSVVTLCCLLFPAGTHARHFCRCALAAGCSKLSTATILPLPGDDSADNEAGGSVRGILGEEEDSEDGDGDVFEFVWSEVLADVAWPRLLAQGASRHADFDRKPSCAIPLRC